MQIGTNCAGLYVCGKAGDPRTVQPKSTYHIRSPNQAFLFKELDIQASFYANLDLRQVSALQESDTNKPSVDLSELLKQLQSNPELTKALAGILSSQ